MQNPPSDLEVYTSTDEPFDKNSGRNRNFIIDLIYQRSIV